VIILTCLYWHHHPKELEVKNLDQPVARATLLIEMLHLNATSKGKIHEFEKQ